MHFRSHTEHEKLDNVKIITSCCIGEIIPLERLSNDVFSSLILGDGFGVIPSDGEFVSPVEGAVKDVSANAHEITVKTDDNMIIMISVETEPGCPPLNLTAKVAPGDRVSRGTPLWSIDLEKYGEKGITAAIIVTNSDSLPSFNIRYGSVKQLDQPVMTISVI